MDLTAKIDQLKAWLTSHNAARDSKLLVKRFKGPTGERTALIAADDVQPSKPLLTLSEEFAVTALDARKDDLVGDVSAECSELVALTLWLMVEKAKGQSSKWNGFIASLPDTVLTPILWSEEDVTELLAGSPVQAEARQRAAALKQQWAVLAESKFSDKTRFSPDIFNEANFLNSFCVVVACSVYLPSAELFALIPVISLISRTGNNNGCDIDYDAEQQAVVVTTKRPFRAGQEVMLNDGRPNGEMLLATGTLQDNNTSDFLLFKATLLEADKYYPMKQQILDSMDLGREEQFPVYLDRFPNQLLAFVRLARLQDPVLFAKVSFDQDMVLSQMNEYEVLQLLMGDCRERLQAYKLTLEEDIKTVQQGAGLSPQALLAARLRLAEKQIISATMDALRRKLAPIRGIPTKGGKMTDPNQDIKEVFELFESIPSAPAKLLGGFLSWAKGEDDPEWGGKDKRQR